MKNEMQQYIYNNQAVRMETVEGKPWFLAKDVCGILNISKYRDAIALLDVDERGSILVDTLGGQQQMVAINESGLYSLIMQSRKPEARRFKRWVTHDVLPSIRRNGHYSAIEEPDQRHLQATKHLLSAVEEQDERIERLERRVDNLVILPDPGEVDAILPKFNPDYMTLAEWNERMELGMDHN